MPLNYDYNTNPYFSHGTEDFGLLDPSKDLDIFNPHLAPSDMWYNTPLLPPGVPDLSINVPSNALGLEFESKLPQTIALHTDEAFVCKQRMGSSYVPSISGALDETASRGSISPPPTLLPHHHHHHHPRFEYDQPSPLTSGDEQDPISRLAAPSPGSTESDEEAQTYLYYKFRFRNPPRSSSKPGPIRLPLRNDDTGSGDKAKVCRAQHLACFFCRRRKIACVAPQTNDPNRTCNQCERRGLRCSFPVKSYRGLRYASRESRGFP